jgi:cell division septation protein DedD
MTTTEEAAPRTESPAPAPGRQRRWLLGALAGAAVLFLIAAVVLGLLLVRNLETSPQAVSDYLRAETDEATERSESVITLLLNYDATTIDEVSREMLEVSTGNFREQYEQLLPNLAPALQEAAASSRGQILEGPDISFRSSSEAFATARVTQTAQSQENPEGRTIDYVLKLTLVKTADEGWKADRVEVLSTTQAS